MVSIRRPSVTFILEIRSEDDRVIVFPIGGRREEGYRAIAIEVTKCLNLVGSVIEFCTVS